MKTFIFWLITDFNKLKRWIFMALFLVPWVLPAVIVSLLAYRMPSGPTADWYFVIAEWLAVAGMVPVFLIVYGIIKYDDWRREYNNRQYAKNYKS